MAVAARPSLSTHLSVEFRNQKRSSMPIHSIHHGPAILREYRKRTWVNALRYITAETKFKVRVGMVMAYVAGIAFSVGTFVGVVFMS